MKSANYRLNASIMTLNTAINPNQRMEIRTQTCTTKTVTDQSFFSMDTRMNGHEDQKWPGR
jgi:hypothetical protein